MAGLERKGGLTPSIGREWGGAGCCARTGGGGGGDSRNDGGNRDRGGGEEAVRISQSGLVRERILERLVRLVRLGCRIELTGDRGDTLTLGLITCLHILLLITTLHSTITITE